MAEDLPHILVVDDDTRLRELLARFLSENGFRVTTATDSADARARMRALAYDVIVLDVMMPGESGLELTEELRRMGDVPILLLTAMAEPEDRIAGLERGADDYLPKPFEPRELLLRLRAILRRTTTPVPAGADPLVRLGPCLYDPDRGELRRNGERVRLTTAEQRLLTVLAASAGATVSREDLGERAQLSGNTRAIDVQITRLRRKIESDPRDPRYLHTVRGQGYMLQPD